MRTAPRRVRSLLALFALVCSVGWMLLRRRSEPAAEPAVEPAVEPVAGRPVDVLATDAGLTPQPAVEPAPAADPEPVTEVPTEVLATDAGLTAAPPAAPAAPPTASAAPVEASTGEATDAGPAPVPAAHPEPATGVPADVSVQPAEVPAEPPRDDNADTMVLPVQSAVDAPAPTGTDNLRAIRGIGPAIERMLHELDITTFRQVAELDGPQLDRVRARLQEFPARIEREDWVGQAKRLHEAKYGDNA